MAYEVMTGMINLEDLEVKANEITEISAGARTNWPSQCCSNIVVIENK